MSKRKLPLSTPIEVREGMTQTSVEIDYLFVREDRLTVHTKQGNVIDLPMNENRQTFLERLEDAVLARLEAVNTPKED